MTGLIVSDRTGENIERGSFDRTGDSAPVSLNRPLGDEARRHTHGALAGLTRSERSGCVSGCLLSGLPLRYQRGGDRI